MELEVDKNVSAPVASPSGGDEVASPVNSPTEIASAEAANETAIPGDGVEDEAMMSGAALDDAAAGREAALSPLTEPATPQVTSGAVRSRPRIPSLLWWAVGLVALVLFGYYFYQNTLALPLPSIKMVAATDFPPRTQFSPSPDTITSMPIGLGVDDKGNMYVISRETDNVYVFDAQGKLTATWPLFADGNDGKQLVSAQMYKGHIYALDKNSSHLYEYDTSGKVVMIHNQDNKVTWSSPNGFCFDDQDNLYVASTAGSEIVKTDSQGRLVARIGSRNVLPAAHQLDQPFACAIGADGAVYAANINGVINKYDKEGNFVSQLPTRWLGGQLADGLRMAADRPRNRIYIADSVDDVLVMIDTTNDSFTAYGSPIKSHARFNQIMAVTTNDNGDIYTVEGGNRRLQIFARP